MIGSFIAGGIMVFNGGVQALKSLDLGGFESIFSMFEGDGKKTEYTERCEVELSFTDAGIESVILENVPHNVEIVAGNDFNVRYEGRWPADLDKNTFAKIDGNDLVVEMEGSNGGVSFNMFEGCSIDTNFGGDLTVTIPEEYAGKIIVKNGVGDIDINNINAQALSFESMVGEIKCENISASDVTLESVVGDISVEGSFTSINLDDCIGEIDASTKAAIENNCRIADCMGNIDFAIGKESKVDVQFEGNFTAFDNKITETAGGTVIDISDCMGEINIDYYD